MTYLSSVFKAGGGDQDWEAAREQSCLIVPVAIDFPAAVVDDDVAAQVS